MHKLVRAPVEHAERHGLLHQVRHGIPQFRCRLAEQVVTGVALWIQVYHQRALAPGRTDGRQVTGDAGLAHTTFLIEYNPSHVVSPVNTCSYWSVTTSPSRF